METDLQQEVDQLTERLTQLTDIGDALVGALENGMMATAVVFVEQWKNCRHA